jgi:DNA-binding XRE family transcriptional regulator
MAMVDLGSMTLGEIEVYVESLEDEIKLLRAKTDNRKKLDHRDAQRIRRLYNTRDVTQQDLAEMFDVNDATISRIIRGKYYPEAA